MPSKPLPKLRGVLFDWDGTLLDSFHADSNAYLAMFKEMGIPWGLAELERHYAPNWYDVYRAAGLPKAQWQAADAAWRRNYLHHRPRLMPGARRILHRLAKRYFIGLVTSGDRDRVLLQLKTHRLTAMFPVRICAGDTNEKKPHPAPLLRALKDMKLAASESVYVGDSPQDIEMSRAAGVLSIGIVGPFPTERRLRAAKPDFFLETLARLPATMRLIAGQRSQK